MFLLFLLHAGQVIEISESRSCLLLFAKLLKPSDWKVCVHTSKNGNRSLQTKKVSIKDQKYSTLNLFMKISTSLNKAILHIWMEDSHTRGNFFLYTESL